MIAARRSGAVVAVAEQLVYTGTQFLFNLALARFLDAADYGRYALNVSFVILSSVIHFCFVFEAAQVNGGRAAVRWMLSPFARTTAISMMAGAVYFAASGAWAMVVPSAAYLAGYNAYWMARSVWHVNRAFGASLAVCLGVASLYLGALVTLHLFRLPVTVLLVALGGAKIALAGAILWCNRARNGLAAPALGERPRARRWYGFGVESFISQVLIWSVLNLPVLYLGTRRLLEEAAIMNVVYTFLVPCQSVLIALFSFYLPSFVKLGRNPPEALRLLRRSSLAAGMLAGGYSLVLLFAGSALVRVLFGARFAGLELGLFVVVPLLLSQIISLRSFLKAMGRVRDALLAAVAGAAITAGTILVAEPASHRAIAAGVVVSYLAVLAVMLARVVRWKLTAAR